MVFSLTQAKQKAEVQKSQVTKLEVVDLGEVEVESDFKQSDIQRKRDSGYTYNRPNRISSNTRLRIQTHPSRNQLAFKIPGQLNRPFTQYGPPIHPTADSTTHGYAQQHRNKLQHDISQQHSINFGGTGFMGQEVPSPIRNVDFVEVNPISSQNDLPFGVHTAKYLPPQNQRLPMYSSTDNFNAQSFPGQGQVHGTSSQSQNFVQAQSHQISDAAHFLSENAQAIQQLYGAPASNQDFAPSYDQFQNVGNPIHNLNNQFEGTLPNPEEFRDVLPSYASETLDPQKTLEQIQSLEKDRLIVQLQQALAQAQTNSNVAGRYAQNQAGFVQNQELLASISQQLNSHVPTTPQSTAFGSENTAFSQSTFLPETTINPLRLPINYGVPTTTQTPTTTTAGILTTQSPSQPSKGDSTAQVVSSQSAANQPGSSTTGSPAGIPVYGGFVPTTFITGTNLIPSYGTGIFTSGLVRPVQSSETSPTHFGIPIPTEPPQKPVAGSAPPIPAAIPALSPAAPPSRPGVALTSATITPVALPIQPLRPVAPLATPVHPIAASLLPTNPTQVHPAQTTPAVTSSVQHTYGVQTALINPVLYKPVKAVYPVYYYPANIAYQLQKPISPNYPWNYAPSYTAQTGPAKIWK